MVKREIKEIRYLIPFGYELDHILKELIRIFSPARNIVIITNERSYEALKEEKFVFGEDYYLYSLAVILKGLGFKVTCSKEMSTILIKNHDCIVFSNISPIKQVLSKPSQLKDILKKKCIFTVTMVGHKTDNIRKVLHGRIGLIAAKVFVDYFIVTSHDLLNLLNKVCPRSQIVLVPPIVPIKNHNHGILLPTWNIEDLKEITVTYIGSLLPSRVEVVKSLLFLREILKEPKINLDIYSQKLDKEYVSVIRDIARRYGIHATIHNRYLTEHEKCRVLKQALFFISPDPLATMRPPISVLEALYHGVIPIPFRPYYLALLRGTSFFKHYLSCYKQLAESKVFSFQREGSKVL